MKSVCAQYVHRSSEYRLLIAYVYTHAYALYVIDVYVSSSLHGDSEMVSVIILLYYSLYLYLSDIRMYIALA